MHVLVAGHGKYTHNDGDEYIGSFLNNMCVGRGKYTYRSKEGDSTYVGNFDEQREGYGVLIYANGDTYKGE